MIEQTLLLIKHDGVSRGLIGEIIGRFERVGLKVCGMKMVLVDATLAQNHYQATPAWTKAVAEKTRKGSLEKGVVVKETDQQIADRVLAWNKAFLREGPVVAVVLEGPHAIEICRKMVGHTEPRQALPGTIRGDLTYESYVLGDLKQRPIRNLVHASSSQEEALREIRLWFAEREIYNYLLPHDKHIL